MKSKIILLAIVSLFSLQAVSQKDFTDLKFDSTIVFTTKENKIHQIDFFSKNKLVMQKFYPKGSSIGGFCHGTNLVYDSILVHLGINNYVAKFSRGGQSVTVYSWNSNSNIVNIDTYNRTGNISNSRQEVRIPDSSSPYPLCWYENYRIGIEKKLNEGILTIIRNHEEAMVYSNNFKDTLTLNPIFIKLKEQAISLLKTSYSKKILSKYLVFNLERSCFYKVNQRTYYSRKEPRHNSGIPLLRYNANEDQIAYVDIAFDMQIENNRFNCISLRLDDKGNLINKPIKLWKRYENSSIGLNHLKITKLITPNKAKEIAKEYSKWLIEGNASVNLEWVSESDSLGKLIYLVNYDFVKRGWDASYVRQVQIDATSGEFLKEIEVSSLIESEVSSSKFKENGKSGFKDWSDIVIPAEYEQLPNYYSSFMIAKKNGKFGVINGENEVLIDFIYDRIEFHKSTLNRYNYWYLILTEGEYQGLYEKQKGILIPVQYKKLVENKNEQITAVSKDGEKIVLNLRTGKIE